MDSQACSPIPSSNPIKPGEARPCDVWLQAAPNKDDFFKVKAELEAWPYDLATKQENKNNEVKKTRLRIGFVESITLERCFGRFADSYMIFFKSFQSTDNYVSNFCVI